MITVTYFVHGTTIDNENERATGWLPGELSEVGKTQADDLGHLVADKHFDAVFCSDLKRAVDSTELAFGGTYDIIPDTRLREVNYGDYNGTAESEFKDDMARYVETPYPNGESYKDVEARVRNFLGDVSQKYDGKRIAIVAHQAPQLALDVIVKSKTWEQAIKEDWRNTRAWQPGWEYVVDKSV
ncbi:MAG: histidine phosphatase family protein [Parcubacteria group bacterium]|nr:histidine phosphatase family protein [Parcubacteria group bacterium]